MRIVLDDDLCQGHQACAIVAPEVFGSDEIGNAVLLITGDIPSDMQELARRAQRNCPEHAIIIID
jgi:ferredoxin